MHLGGHLGLHVGQHLGPVGEIVILVPPPEVPPASTFPVPPGRAVIRLRGRVVPTQIERLIGAVQSAPTAVVTGHLVGHVSIKPFSFKERLVGIIKGDKDV